MKLTSVIALFTALLSMSIALYPKIKSIKSIEKKFKFVPSGLAVVESDTLSVQAFKMLDHEVTNAEYTAFLREIKESKPELFAKVQIDKNGWQKHFPNGFVKPMDDLYYFHESYNDYPVVNISQFAAKEYCKWLGTKLNKGKSEEEKIIVRLPNRAEFIRAGAGSNLNFQYAWGNQYMTNSEGKYLCNFTRLLHSSMSRGKEGEVVVRDTGTKLDFSRDHAMYMAKVKSYYPSQFGLYNLNGNVAEWLSDENLAAGGSWYDFGYDVRLQSIKKEEGASPEVGFRPVFTVPGKK